MIPGIRFDLPAIHRSRAEQLGLARMEARTAAGALGHTLGEWRSGGMVSDDEATCVHCRRAVFLTYGTMATRPLLGLRRSGTALRERCDPPQGVR